MRRHNYVAVAFLGLAVVLVNTRTVAQTSQARSTVPQTNQAKNTVEEIRKELLQLPYYSVFDFIVFSYDKGTVTLAGYAYAPRLKADAERAVKRASGVDQVVNKIEELPPNPN